MGTGLDFGTGAIRSASGRLEDPSIQSEPAIVVPADADRLLSAGFDPIALRTIEADGTDRSYVVGSDAKLVASRIDESPITLYSNGVLRVDDYVEPAIYSLIKATLDGTQGVGEESSLCYTTPGTLLDEEEPTAAHRDLLQTVFVDMGIDATPVSKGFAVVYDQLAEDKYTGLGICIEAQSTSVALAYYGVPVMVFSLAKGTDWIVERAAGETGHARSQVASVFEDFRLDPNANAGGIESALAHGIDDLAAELVDAIDEQATERDVQDLPVPVAVGGDGAIEGVEFLFGGRFDAADLPFSIRGVRLADDPAASPARGALAAAEDGVDAYEDVTWSDGNAESPSNGPGTTADGVDPGLDDGMGGTVATFEDFATGEDDGRADDAITQLFDRLGTRDEEIDSVSQDVDELFADLEDLDERTPAVEDVETLTEDFESLQDSLSTTETTLEAVRTDIDRLEAVSNETREALETDVTRLESDLVDVRDHTLSVEDEMGGLRTTLERLEDESATEAALGDLREDLDVDLGDVRDEFESVTRTVRERLEIATEEIEALRNTAASLETELADVDASVTRVRDDVSERLDEHASEMSTVSDRLDSYRSETSDRLESVESDVDDRIDHVRTEFLNEVDGVHSNLDGMESALERVEDRLETLSSSIERTRVDLEETVERTRGDLEETVDLELETIEETLDDRLDDRLGELRKRLDSFEEHAVADSRVDTLEGEIESLSTAVNTIENAVESVETEIDANRSRIENEIGAIEATAVARTEDLESDLESVRKTVDALSSEIGTLSSDHEDVSSTVSELGEAITERPTDDDIEILEERTEMLEDRSEVLDERTNVLQERFDDGFDILDSEYASTAQLEDIRSDLSTIQTGHTETAEILGDIGDTVNTLEGTTASLTTDVETLRLDLESISSEDEPTGDTYSAIDDVESAVSDVQSAIEDVDARLASLEDGGDEGDHRSPNVVTPILAGAGSAGLVAGALVTFSVGGQSGYVVVALGAVILALALLSADRLSR